MLRMSSTRGPGDRTTVHLEGRIVGPWVAELARFCGPLLQSGEKLDLDFRDVSFISREGVRLIWTLRDRQVALTNCSRFVAELLKAIEEMAP